MQTTAATAPRTKIGVCDSRSLAARRSNPGEGDPDLAGHAVHERQDLGAALARHDVVEGAPDGVRQPALGHLLGEPEADRGREGEPDEPDTEPGEVDERQDEGDRRDPEAGVEAIGEDDRDDERQRRDRDADSRPRAVARSRRTGRPRSSAPRNGYETEKNRTANRT